MKNLLNLLNSVIENRKAQEYDAKINQCRRGMLKSKDFKKVCLHGIRGDGHYQE